MQISLPVGQNVTTLYPLTVSRTSPVEISLLEQRAEGLVLAGRSYGEQAYQLVCLGLDICGSGRWQRMLERTPASVERAFTEQERRWAMLSPARLAGLWTLKEAFVKALGCGFGELAYRGVAVTFGPDALTITLPASLAGELPDIQDLSQLHWQVVLFGDAILPGALICAWQERSQQAGLSSEEPSPESRIVLELSPVEPAQALTRSARQIAERQAARQAAFHAASSLLEPGTFQQLSITHATGGRPLLLLDESNALLSRELVLSLSHCSGRGAAAVGIGCKANKVSRARRMMPFCEPVNT